MANLKVNTDAVISAAQNIKLYNSMMRDGIMDLNTAMTKLNQAWDGSASNTALSKFEEIKSKMCDARYKVMDNYANFLLQQIGEGYEVVEEANKSLADQFK